MPWLVLCVCVCVCVRACVRVCVCFRFPPQWAHGFERTSFLTVRGVDQHDAVVSVLCACFDDSKQNRMHLKIVFFIIATVRNFK